MQKTTWYFIVQNARKNTCVSFNNNKSRNFNTATANDGKKLNFKMFEKVNRATRTEMKLKKVIYL